MKTIQITVPKVHCVKKNDLLNKDKVYLVLIVNALKADVNVSPRVAFCGLSPIAEFKKNDIKILDLGTKWSFNLEEGEAFNITFGLYEKDNGKAYNDYLKKITEIVETNGMTYSDALMKVWDKLKDKLTSLNWISLLTLLPEVGLEILKNFREDDLLGRRTITFKYDDPNMQFVPEFDLTDAESFYKIQLKLTD